MQRFYTGLLMLILLLTFAGQSIASVTMKRDMSSKYVNMHAFKSVDVTNSSSHHALMKMDCCEEQSASINECSCPINGCMANVMLNIETLLSFALFQSEKIDVFVLSEQTTLPKSLFRPPMPA